MASLYRGALPGARLLLLAVVLSGCAAERAYRDGEQLLSRNQVEAGLNKLSEARRLEPDNAQYGLAYMRARERAAGAAADQAELAMAHGQAAAARAAWERLLTLEPGSARARAGLQALEAEQRHGRLLASADAALAAGEATAARRSAEQVLAERPSHARARAMVQSASAALPAPGVDELIAPLLRQPISIEFKDAPLKQAFEIISHSAGVNFVFDKDVKTDLRTTLFLRNTTVAAALHYLLLTNQLEQQVMDANTLLIYPNAGGKVKDYQALRVRNFYLAYADAKSVAATLKSVLKVRDLAVDEKLNLVVVRDSPELLALVEQQLALLDVAEPEVMLDVEILEVTRSRITDLGIEWPASLTLAPLSDIDGKPLTLDTLRHLRNSDVGVTGLSGVIRAHSNDGDSNTLAHPRIRVRNREKAKVVIGDKVPNITTTISPGAGGFASESVSYLDVGLTLNVEPTIYLNDEVAIRVSMEVSNLVGSITTKSGTTAYQIGTRQAGTLLQLRDGENQVLAGLISNNERSSGSKIPGLGNLPLLGRLFGSQHDDNNRTEIVLSITPHLIRNIQRPAASLADFAAGTESSARRRPDSNVRLPTQPLAVLRQTGTPAPAATAVPSAVTLTPSTAVSAPAAAAGDAAPEASAEAASERQP